MTEQCTNCRLFVWPLHSIHCQPACSSASSRPPSLIQMFLILLTHHIPTSLTYFGFSALKIHSKSFGLTYFGFPTLIIQRKSFRFSTYFGFPTLIIHYFPYIFLHISHVVRLPSLGSGVGSPQCRLRPTVTVHPCLLSALRVPPLRGSRAGCPQPQLRPWANCDGCAYLRPAFPHCVTSLRGRLPTV